MTKPASLTERDMQIVKMRYGITGGRPHTLEEIGKKYNLTRERVRQIEKRALKQMQRHKEAMSESEGDKCA